MSFLENLDWRYATKNFSGEKVSQENLEKILKAIQYAPSSFGAQPYHIYVVSNSEVLQKLKLHAKNNEKKFDTCSHMLVFCARTDVQKRFEGLERIQKRTDGYLSKVGFFFQYFFSIAFLFFLGRLDEKLSWAQRQTYIALGFGLAACAELMVDSCPMEGFEPRAFAKILNVPDGFYPCVLLALGYRDSESKIFPKARYPQNDLFSFLN